MEDAMSMHMAVDEPDAVGVHIPAGRSVEIDAVFKEDGTGNSGTIIGDSFALTRDRPCSDQPCCGLNDGRSTGQRRHKWHSVALRGQCGRG